MGILDKLLSQGSQLSNLDGATASIPNFADSKFVQGDETLDQSNLNLSINPGKSALDLDGETPSKYVNNLPE
tara:strand:+ start:828 stop:1043 length:216 start_codon:yes stop_codon:yes gene_type:complete